MNAALLSDFKNHVDQQQSVVTLQVYLELCEVKRYHNISYIYNTNIEKIIILASKTKNGPICAFIPLQVHEELTFSIMKKYSLSNEYETVYLAIVHPDSTCVYYQIKEGLVEPTEMSAKHLKENKQEKRDADIKTNRDLLHHAALTGVPITLRKGGK